MDTSANDFLQLKSTMTEYYNGSEELLTETQKFVSKVQESTNTKGKGFSLLNVKNQEIISCLTNAALLICKLSMGESVEGTKIIEVISSQRKIIEKFRNIDTKIKNQIECMFSLKTEENGAKMCARPDALIIDSEDDDDEVAVEDKEEEESDDNDGEDNGENDDKDEEDSENEDILNTKKLKTKISILPKDDENNSKKHCRINRLKKQALNSSLVKDLRKEYSEAPEEYIEGQEIIGDRFERSKKERKKFEENYFTRLPTNKREKHLETKKFERSGMDSLLSFGKYRIPGENDLDDGGKGKSQRKRKFGGGFKGASNKKFSKKFKKGKRR